MVKVYGPLGGMSASGTIANAFTFSNWKGRAYVRQRVIPANPKSGMQVGMRSMMSALAKLWASLSTVQHSKWDDLAAQTSISPFNAFIAVNQGRWKQWKGPVIDPTDTSANGTESVMGAGTASGGPNCNTISAVLTTLNDGWLYILHHGLTGAYDRAVSNAVHVWYAAAAATLTWVHSPIAAGLHHYVVSKVTQDGLMSMGIEEFDGTAT